MSERIRTSWSGAVLPALSVRQPWASAILGGIKPVENRDWSTGYRGPLLIHAGRKLEQGDIDALAEIIRADGRAEWMAWLEAHEPTAMPRGGVIGRVDLVDVVTAHPSPFFFGRYGWVMRAPQHLPLRPCRGELGLFAPRYQSSQQRAELARRPAPEVHRCHAEGCEEFGCFGVGPPAQAETVWWCVRHRPAEMGLPEVRAAGPVGGTGRML